MITKEYLFQARKIDLEIKSLIDARDNIYCLLTSATSELSSMPKGASNPHKFDKLVELTDEIEIRIDEAIVIKNDVFNAIQCLDSREEKAVMTDFYMNGFTIWEIANRLNYSVKQVKRIKQRAVDKICDCQKMSPNVLECPMQ